MKSQTPAEGILKIRDFGTSVSYKVTCECGDDSHSHNIWVEADDSGVSVTIFTTAKSKWWQLNRWKKIWTLLTKGYVEYEADVIMSEQQALNYSATLAEAVKQVKQREQERKFMSKK
jgi:hypothetical protein